jgi:hypothetical protein
MRTVTTLGRRQVQYLAVPDDPYVADLEAKAIHLAARMTSRSTSPSQSEVMRSEARVWAQARALYLGRYGSPDAHEGHRPDAFLRNVQLALGNLREKDLAKLRHPACSRDRVVQQDILDGLAA